MDALQPDRHADLDWIAAILSAPPIEASVTRSGAADTGGIVQTFGIFPTAAQPRLLLSLESARAAAALLRGGSHARELQVRLGRALLRAGLRVGLAQHLLRDRLCFVVGGKGAAPGLADVLLSEHLADVLGLSDPSFAVRLGRVRPNRKPLIQVVTREGAPVGYVLDFLAVVETDTISLDFKDEMSQAVLKPLGGEGYEYTYVIMPMRI